VARLGETTEAREEETLDARFAFFSASNFAFISACATAINRQIKFTNSAFGSLLELPLMPPQTSAQAKSVGKVDVYKSEQTLAIEVDHEPSYGSVHVDQTGKNLLATNPFWLTEGYLKAKLHVVVHLRDREG
jgi:hypothetical protein